jgi:hypothetical protein
MVGTGVIMRDKYLPSDGYCQCDGARIRGRIADRDGDGDGTTTSLILFTCTVVVVYNKIHILLVTTPRLGKKTGVKWVQSWCQ